MCTLLAATINIAYCLSKHTDFQIGKTHHHRWLLFAHKALTILMYREHWRHNRVKVRNHAKPASSCAPCAFTWEDERQKLCTTSLFQAIIIDIATDIAIAPRGSLGELKSRRAFWRAGIWSDITVCLCSSCLVWPILEHSLFGQSPKNRNTAPVCQFHCVVLM